MDVTTKQCYRCEQSLPIDGFSLNGIYRRNTCKSCRTIQTREYNEANLEKVQYQRRKHRQADPQRHRDRSAKWRAENPERCRAHSRTYVRERHRSDPAFRLKRNLRTRIYNCLRNGYKSAGTMDLLGCSFEAFQDHMQSLFQPGMTWENHGQGSDKWHIDHIRPCASFDLSDAEQQRVCFHYTNHQPLWQPDNIRKSDHLDYSIVPSTAPLNASLEVGHLNSQL